MPNASEDLLGIGVDDSANLEKDPVSPNNSSFLRFALSLSWSRLSCSMKGYPLSRMDSKKGCSNASAALVRLYGEYLRRADKKSMDNGSLENCAGRIYH